MSCTNGLGVGTFVDSAGVVHTCGSSGGGGDGGAAATAGKLLPGATINGVFFDGSSNIVIPGSGSVTSVATTVANGLVATVTNPTTNVNIAISGVNLTPQTVVASGNITAANLSGTNTGDQTNISGNAATATYAATAGNAATVTTNANLTGDVTSIGNAATVVKINGVTMSGLTTGILKNTTGTGAPSIATAGTDYVTPTGTETLSGKTLTNPTVNNYTEGTVASGTVTTTATLSLTSGTFQTATLTASTACVFTMPTPTSGKSFVLLLKQAASTGLGTATFTGVKWPAGTAPTITPTAGRMDILTFASDGTNWYGAYTQNYTP